MHPQKSRFVALCQQLLVLGAVGVVLVPAASVVNLDVVRGESSTAQGSGSEAVDSITRAVVPVGSVDPVVHETALTPGSGRRTPASRSAAAAYLASASRVQAVVDTTDDTTTVTSEPQPVDGYGTVGVTWEPGQEVSDDSVSFEVRTQTDGEWGEWTPMEYHDDHGPDAGSAEADGAIPGTQEALVGNVDEVQVRAQGDADEIPAGMTLAVIDPGTPTRTRSETPDIDTSELPVVPDAAPDASGRLVQAPAAAVTEDAEESDAATQDEGELVLAAAVTAARPTIFSRAQWGANERIREKGNPDYGTIQGGFVHHTVNANSYTAAQVPGIIQSIYAYHVKSRGWRDIGYNFLVDRFGRIWEGRYGGVDRPVVGAHTEGYNSNSFAGSAIGNFDIAAPPQPVIDAFASLMAWKLSLHGVPASAKNVRIGKRVFASSIMGHRDTKATACPGKYLYAKIPAIRTAAASLQRTGTAAPSVPAAKPAPRTGNLVGSAHPDIVARRASDKRAVVIPTTGFSGFSKRTSTRLAGRNRPVLSPDLTGDRRPDLLVISAAGKAVIRPGNGKGGFGKGIRTVSQAGRKLVTAVGDVNRDGRNDLFSVSTSTRRGTVYFGTPRRGVFRAKTMSSRIFDRYTMLSAADVDGNGTVDLVGRDRAGRLWVHPGRGNGGFPHRARLTGAAWRSYDAIVPGDFTRDGRTDLLVRVASNHDTYVLPGLGRNAFGKGIGPYPALRKQTSVLSALDVTGDGLLEVMATYGSRLDLVSRTAGTDLGVPVVTNLSLAAADVVLNAGDWNRDGKGDLITREGGTLKLYRGNGNGTFQAGVSMGTGWNAVTMIAAVGDVNSDGRVDLMAQTKSNLVVFPGNGSAGFLPTYAARGPVSGSTQIGVGPWDAGVAPDVLVRNGAALTLYPGNGAGKLLAPRTVSNGLAPYDVVLGVGDLQLTGHPDLLARERGTGGLYALQGTASGGLAAPRYLGSLAGYDLVG